MKRLICLCLVLVSLFPSVVLGAQAENPGERVPVRSFGQTDKLLGSGLKEQDRVQFIAEMGLSQPTRFALIRDEETGQVTLHRPDGPIFLDRDPLPLGRILWLEDSSLIFAMPNGQSKEVREGSILPISRRLTYRGSVVLERLRFQARYSGPNAAPGDDYSVVEIAGREAILQRNTLPGESQIATGGWEGGKPSQAQSRAFAGPGSASRVQEKVLAGLVESLPIHEMGPNTWEVPLQDARAVGRSVSQVLFEALSSARPSLTPSYGAALNVDTSVGAGTLDRRGFLVEDPKLASRAGLETGDRILTVNEQPVNSFSGLYRIYQTLKSDSEVSDVKVVINRNSQLQTLTYHLR